MTSRPAAATGRLMRVRVRESGSLAESSSAEKKRLPAALLVLSQCYPTSQTGQNSANLQRRAATSLGARNLLPQMHKRLFCGYSRGGTRTPDPVINSHLLYQLSYSGKCSNCNDLLPQTQPRTGSRFSIDAPDSTAPVPTRWESLVDAPPGQATPEAFRTTAVRRRGSERNTLRGQSPTTRIRKTPA
jgi:hypothetical protein